MKAFKEILDIIGFFILCPIAMVLIVLMPILFQVKYFGNEIVRILIL
jgi:hypothetical protein